MQEMKTIKFNNSTDDFSIKYSMTCISKNLIYCITCAKNST